MKRDKDDTEVEWAVKMVCEELRNISWGDAARGKDGKWGAIEGLVIELKPELVRIGDALERIAEWVESKG